MTVQGSANAAIANLASLSLTQGFSAAVNVAGATSSRQLLSLAKIFDRVGTDTGRRTDIHAQIAKLAQTSTIQSYGQLITRQEGPASRLHYRPGATGSGRLLRFAGGKMLAALGSPDFVQADANGIRYGNIAVLDATARQWHRLAFGAAGRGTGSHTTFEVRFNSLVVASLGIIEGPSPSFTLPRGNWISPEGVKVPFGANPAGSDQFFLRPSIEGHVGQGEPGHGYSSRGKPLGLSARGSAGILAKNFFDAGLFRIAESLGPAYLFYYRQLWDEARAGIGPLAGEALVHPRALPFRVVSV